MSPSMHAASSPGEAPSLPTATELRTHGAPPRVRRRNRQINSCLECRRRKLKCDKGSPCANCTKLSRPCVFIASGLDIDAQKRIAEVKEKMGILERRLEADVSRPNSSTPGDNIDNLVLNTLPGQDESCKDQEDDEETRDLNPSQYVSEDAAYYDNEDDDNDNIFDLGIAMGKVRITERIGGLVRLRLSEELSHALQELPKSEHLDPNPVSEQDPREWLAPSRDYVAPTSNFFFAPGIEKTSLMTYLPSRTMVDTLMAHYWEAVHCIAKTVHRPSFERHLDKFWANIDAGVEPRISFQAVIFGALLSSIVSMPDSRVLTEFGVSKHSLVDHFKQGTEASLARANFLRTTKLETLQAFVMYLVALCRNEVSRAHSVLTGTVIRLAECMGLHRDPTSYSNSPVEIHVRRLIWYQICFLDLRTCEATGPRPQVRPDDYDTRFPLNIDDTDLDRAEHGERGVDVSKDRNHFTDMTITRMRFECYEMHRLLWNERPKLEQKRANGERKVTLITLLSRVQSFKAAMEKTYLPMLSKSVPLHALASEIYGILSDRLYLLLLQKYLSSDRNKMPVRLRQLVMSAAVTVLERSMVIEQQPALSIWKWYVGALHQYHTALLLLNELYAAHTEPEVENRIWRCLNFAFDTPSDGSNIENLRLILEELVGKTRIYADMKKLRVPTDTPHAGPRTHTAGYQARQQERMERSEAVHSERSDSSVSVHISENVRVAPHAPSPPEMTDLHWKSPAHNMSFPGAIPSVDWGTVDFSASMPNFQRPFPVTEPYSPAHHSPPGSRVPTTTILGINEFQRNDASDFGTAMNAGLASGVTSGTFMATLNDIDWSEIEQMLGGSEAGSGMFVPPFSFPQFSPSDLNT